jgi:hypothetical protein
LLLLFYKRYEYITTIKEEQTRLQRVIQFLFNQECITTKEEGNPLPSIVWFLFYQRYNITMEQEETPLLGIL